MGPRGADERDGSALPDRDHRGGAREDLARSRASRSSRSSSRDARDEYEREGGGVPAGAHARARALRDPPGRRRPLARASRPHGLPPRGHRPARDGAEGSARRVHRRGRALFTELSRSIRGEVVLHLFHAELAPEQAAAGARAAAAGQRQHAYEHETAPGADAIARRGGGHDARPLPVAVQTGVASTKLGRNDPAGAGRARSTRSATAPEAVESAPHFRPMRFRFANRTAAKLPCSESRAAGCSAHAVVPSASPACSCGDVQAPAVPPVPSRAPWRTSANARCRSSSRRSGPSWTGSVVTFDVASLTARLAGARGRAREARFLERPAARGEAVGRAPRVAAQAPPLRAAAGRTSRSSRRASATFPEEELLPVLHETHRELASAPGGRALLRRVRRRRRGAHDPGRRRRHGRAGLGRDPPAHVPALGRAPRLQDRGARDEPGRGVRHQVARRSRSKARTRTGSSRPSAASTASCG